MSESGVCYPLAEDVDLAEAVDVANRASAATALAARELVVGPGVLRSPAVPGDGGFGMLVLEGVLLHRVGIEDRFGAELLGEGDVLFRLDDDFDGMPLHTSAMWTALRRTRLAVLDERFVRQLAAFPRLSGQLFQRSVMRSRHLSVNLAIIHQARVDVRVHMLLWHLAGRWGRVRGDGVVLPLRLTHATLAELVAARRPTVSSAISELTRAGLLAPLAEGWLLCGEPPGELDGAAGAPGATAGVR